MNILVIGGTRFIGPYVVRELHDAGNHVTVFHRGRSKTELPEGVETITGDRNQLSDYRDAFRKSRIDVVIDMILITEHQAESLVSTFKGIADRIIGISSQDVYQAYGIMLGKEAASLQSTPLTEDSALRSRLYPYRGDTPRAGDDPQKILDDYDKIPIERILMHTPEIAGTVLRLPMVYGPGDYQHRLFEYLKRMDDRRPAIILEKGLAEWKSSFGFVENVAHAICCAVNNRKAENCTYNIADAENMTQEVWVRKIKSVTAWNGMIVVMPGEVIPKHLKPGFCTDQHLDVSTERIRSELGYKEIIPLDRALISTIEWERRNPPAKVDPSQYDYDAEDQILKTYERQNT